MVEGLLVRASLRQSHCVGSLSKTHYLLLSIGLIQVDPSDITETIERLGVQWLSGRVLDSRARGRGFEPHRHHCIVSLSKTH